MAAAKLEKTRSAAHYTKRAGAGARDMYRIGWKYRKVAAAAFKLQHITIQRLIVA